VGAKVRVNQTLKKIGNGERSRGKVLVGGSRVVRVVEEERVGGRRVSIVILMIMGVRSRTLMMIV
jgi:hypothetical protein